MGREQKKGRAGSRGARTTKFLSRKFVEELESRLLLATTPVTIYPNGLLSSGSSASSILASLPAGVSGQFAPGGLELSISPSQGGYTPNYVMLDPTPQLNPSGGLAPFSTTGPTGMTPAKMRHAYGIDQVMFGNVQGDGSNQTIAIVDAYDYPTITTDLHNFDLAFSLPDPPSVTKLNETGGTTLPGTDPSAKGNDWEVEEALDVEWAHAMAPGASIVLIEANSPTDSDLITNALTTAANLPGVVAITMSFGRSENSSDASLDSLFQTPTGHTGITFLASTGDAGAPGEFPAMSPNVVAVGGTTLNVDANGNYVSESAWSLSGGGLSSYESQPAYQKGIVTQSSTQRGIPDVALDADPATGASIYDTYDFGTTAPWITVGGTSLSSPSWAGLIAIADQGRTIAGAGTLDGPNKTLPRLYAIAASNFHDVTTGSNGNPAGVGYDLVTGRGTPIANTLIPQLSAAGPYVLNSAPSTPQTTPPSSITFNFSAAMDPTSFSIGSDVDSFTGPGNVNLLSSITGFSWLNGNTSLQVNFTPQTTDGTYTMVVGPQILSAGGQPMDQNQNGVAGELPADEYTASWGYDASPLQVVSTNPANGSLVELPFTTLDVNFNEAVDPNSVNSNDLTLSQGTVTGAQVLSPTEVQYTLSGITSEGSLAISLAAGALSKAGDEFPSLAYTGTLAMDIGTVGLPAAVATAPLGSQTYQSTASGAISTPNDTDSFTISLNPGQNLSVVIHPTSPSLRPSVTVLGPTSSVLGTVTAGAANQDAVLQTLPVTTAGTYTIVVASDGVTTGNYTVDAVLNAAVESAEHGGSPDISIATAQSLDSAFDTITGSSSIASVLGALTATTSDYYSISLSAGQTLSLALATLSGTSVPSLALYDSHSNLLASGTTGATNVQSDIASYTAPATGVYYVNVAGTGGNSYSLVATKNAAFSLEPHNTFSSAQNLAGASEAVGYVGTNIAGTTTLTLNSQSEGWWDNTGTHSSTNTNYITGIGNPTETFNSYYVFSLSGITQPIASAQLLIYNPTTGYSSINPTETLGIFDVSTPIASLEASGSGQTAIYNDLGTGTSYGTTTVSASTDGQYVTTTLDSAAIAALNASIGSQFAFGGALLGLSGTSNRYEFGFSTGTLAELIVTLGGGSDWYSLNVNSTNQPIAFSTSTPSQGSGQFTNNLVPHIQVYDPNDNLVATGTKLGDGRNELVTYQPLTTGTYRIQISSQNNSSGEYVLNQGNSLTLNLPSDVHEGDGVDSGTLVASTAPASDLTISLLSSDPSRLTVPTTVTLPAGQTSVSIPLTVIDDNLLNGPETVAISASAAGYFGGTSNVKVHDNETATLNLSLPTTATEGQGTVQGTITASAAPTTNTLIQLSSNLTSRLTVPATITLLAGQTSVNFNATIVDNTVIDGTQNATVTASFENWTSGTATVAVADNDGHINLVLPTSGFENQTLIGTVQLGGTLSSNLTVNLASNNTTELSVPATVTVLAGQTTATFNISLLDDGLKSGPHTVAISASASGLTNGSSNVTVNDSDVDHLAFSSITGPETAGTPFSVTVSAYNVNNQVIPVYNASGTLSATGHAGSLPVSPTSVTFSSGVWTGNVTLTTADPTVSLTMLSSSLTASSSSFIVNPGAVSTFTWSATSSPQIATLPFSETVTAKDAYGNVATGYNGTANLSGLVGTAISENILGTSLASQGSGSINTVGYAFTPSSTVQVTAVRSYWGSKVSIWTNTGTLLASQPVTGTPGVWTVTPLTTPITLTAGTTYRVAAYTTGSSYWNTTSPTFSFAWGTLNGGYSASGDAFPTTTNVYTYLVDLQANVGNFTAVPVTPTTATFTNGVWTGNVTVNQAASGMHLHIDDGSSHTGDSGNFDVIQRTLAFSLPSDVQETDGVVDGLLNVSPSPSSNLIISLSSSDTSRLTVPTTVTIQAGQTSVIVPLTVINDNLLDGLEQVTITGTASGYPTATAAVNVHDNETAVLSVSLPSSATEGNTVVGTVTASVAPTSNVTVTLSNSNPGRVSVPATVVLLAGQTSVNFNATVTDDHIIDGSGLATIGAHVNDWTDGYASMIVNDADGYATVLLPTSGFETQNLTGTVQLGGTLSSNLTINLASNNTTELSVPATVTVLAGQTTATFSLSLLDDGLKSGSHTVSVTAGAPGLTSGSSNITVNDSDVDHLAFSSITGPETAGTPFSVTVSAYNINNQVIPVYNASGTLSATGHAGSLPVSPTAATFSSGVWTGNATLTTADPTVNLSMLSSSLTASSSSFIVNPGAVSSFAWGAVTSPQTVNVPFAETITAQDAYGNAATGYNGTANLSGLIGSTSSQNMLGSPTFTNDFNNGTYTVGYLFTPNTNMQVTDVRSYFGTKVDIWTNTGTLLMSQAVTGSPTVWTTTHLSTPLNLTAGTSYRITVYTAGQLYYWRNVAPTNPSFATLGQTYEISGDAFPTSPDTGQYWLVDLQANVGSFAPVTTTPTTATFVNGVWSGNVTVTQPASAMHLHIDDGSSHTGDSGTFNVLPAAPGAPALLAASDTGTSNSDGITNLNNSSANKTLQFSVANTLTGATVTVFANGVAIGSAVATGSTTIVTTDGVTTLADGPYTITASQLVSPGVQSPVSSGSAIQIDTVIPAPVISPVAPNPTTSPVSSMTITFNKAVSGLALSSFSLSLNGGTNLLTGSQTLTSSDGITWTLGNLSGITAANGTYVLSLAANAAESTAGNLSTATSQSWQNSSSAANFAVQNGSTLDIYLGAAGGVSLASSGGVITATQNGTHLNFSGITGIVVTDTGSGDALNFNGPLAVPFTFTHAASSVVNVNSGTMTFAAVPGGSISLATLSVASGASAVITTATTSQPTTLNVTNLSIGSTGSLDVANNIVSIYYGTNADPISTIAGYLKTGCNSGTWTGTGIFSSAAAVNPYNYALGFADSADPGNPAGLATGTIKIMYTLRGDADLNGIVNGIDLGIVSANYNNGVTSWDQGDFDYNGIVNGIDFGDVAANFNKGLTITDGLPAVTTVNAPAVTPSVGPAIMPTAGSTAKPTAGPEVTASTSVKKTVTPRQTVEPKAKPVQHSKVSNTKESRH